ncbi:MULTISPECIES: nitroreductase family protein [unclassified Pseudodesulfovibrio]|uniref:nitroreductase family protein n=1 Tax=unclassified Pseudodesulfovibrio TaxID=2661612 RepID=UPI000FEBB0A5|nr:MULTISPECIES: nitroreductase family protein [unclassified Pseudodesulfovibrio]MCJ2165455.1 nitroreductase family protein [Pseudodesulfovibrio sp. S3-i]RWU03204.1 nitroreductase family protein [Pseudodesulfovibrio sp. S3]
MEILEALRTRRSIRKYEDRIIPDDMVREILEGAMMAPSAGNAQPWQFVVINDRARLDGMADLHPHIKMVTQAPLGILVCGDLSLEKYPGYWVQDCAAAMENLLLAVHGLGLGAVWTGIYPMEDRVAAFRKMFNLPEHIVPLGFAPIGWPAQQLSSESRFKEDRVHYNTY